MRPIPSTWPARANVAQSFPTLREPPMFIPGSDPVIVGSDPGLRSWG